MVTISDKFTRSGNAEGDIWYATTASSSKSLESLEDNIDNTLLTFLGEDNAGTSTTSNIETKIGEFTVSANTARNRILIFASVTFSGVNSDGSPMSCSFNIRTGTSATATSNTLRESISVSQGHKADGGAAVATSCGGMLIASITSSDEVFTSNFFVHVTSDISDAAGSGTATCNRIQVLGI